MQKSDASTSSTPKLRNPASSWQAAASSPFLRVRNPSSAAVIWRIPLESGVKRLQPWLGPTCATRSIAWYVYSLLITRLEMHSAVDRMGDEGQLCDCHKAADNDALTPPLVARIERGRPRNRLPAFSNEL